MGCAGLKTTTDFVKFAEGSCLIECGDTKVLCCASVEERTPPHVPEGEGWVTAEYSMLPRANRERSKRDVSKLKLSPRSAEIQRLVGRSLRAAVDMAKLGERTITVDCDVLQGDGGTRTASVTGGFIAMALACRRLMADGVLAEDPIRHYVTGVSAGIVEDTALLDLCYSEDSRAQVESELRDERAGRADRAAGHRRGPGLHLEEQQELVRLCAKGNRELLAVQKAALEERMAQVCEVAMLVLFGLSWPFNIAKSLRSRTAKGKSMVFEVFILLGYLCGLIGKFVSGNVTYVVAFYIVDMMMVAADYALTIRNRRLDLLAEKEERSV